MANNKFKIKDYDEQVNKYKELSIGMNHVIPQDKLRLYELPSAKWFVNNCPEKSVTKWGQFVDWCGFYERKYSSKEKAIELILRKQKNLGRSLKYDDFRDTGCYEVPMTYIKNTWGTVNAMKKEIGLPIIQEDMTVKTLDKDKLDSYLLKIKQYVIDSNKPYITRNEINDIGLGVKSMCLDKWCNEYYHKSLGERLHEINVMTGKAGQGQSYTFPDGEITSSQFEYLWSSALRKYGLKYNLDYLRNIPYSEFIPNYLGYMNCDYILYCQNRKIYIEIPGYIDAYKEWYYQNIPINRKSREEYRLKLKKKENMLNDNNLEYYFLFPCDITSDNLIKIINNDTPNLRHQIESHHQHNIEWDIIKKIGELRYLKKNNKLIVDYSNV